MTGRGVADGAKLVSINTSKEKGEVKTPVEEANLVEDYGIEGDVHAGSEIKQVSLLDGSEIEKMEERTGVELNSGDFAENLTSEGLNLDSLPVGTRLRVGGEVLLEVSQIGKTCHDDCAIKDKTGECIMPQKGLFFRVLEGGTVNPGDEIELIKEGN
ncbi:MAG: MOSC domain-containing protein [Candidatus Bipolaricaulota bacterium]|nr:MOSC domain-containing protein [Candidatus Bipolaricaulota bacterium]MBS3791441.1 MOSC domain-containing protein [Candidatus Bipolaricaulota bacterium]